MTFAVDARDETAATRAAIIDASIIHRAGAGVDDASTTPVRPSVRPSVFEVRNLGTVDARERLEATPSDRGAMIELRASVAKRDHQTGLRLSCVALARPDEGASAGATRTTGADGSVGAPVNDAGVGAENDGCTPTTTATTDDNERFLSTLVERGSELVVVGFWESRDAFDPLPALHLLSSASGGTPVFKAVPSEACEAKEREEIESLHFEMCAENKSAVVQVVGQDGRASELHLVAVPSEEGDDEEQAGGEGTAGRRTRFVAFKTEQMAPVYAAPLLVHNRLVVVFDLDETLVQATTLHLLDRRIEQARAKLVSLMKFDFSNPRLSEVMKDEMKKDRASTEQSLRRLQIDRNMLFQYVTEAAITVNGRRSVTIPEIEQLPDGQQRLRNVIRVPSPHIKGSMCVFTMINPADPSTAVLMHVRPGWEELKNYLAGSDRNRSKRAEVFVCTMALKDYAREVCRILDPFNIVFDPMQLDGRLKNVKAEELKSISKTCGLHFPRELTVIVDDRTAVWEAEAQPHILAVTPFMPYGDVGAPMGQNESGGSGGTLGTVQSMLETLRLRWHMDYEKFAVKARAHVHQTADHGVVRPSKEATNDGASTRENADDETDANKEEDVLKRAHNRKKSERLFYPPDAGELLKPLMDLEAKEAAVGIASAGGAARAAGGSGSRLAAALGALDRHQTVKMQNAKLKAQAEAKEDSDAEEEGHEEKEHQPKFRHIDMSTIEEETAAQEARAAKLARQEAEHAEAERVLSMKTPASKKVAKTSPTKQSPKTLSGKKRSRDYSSETDSDEDEPESESEPEPESDLEAEEEEELDDYGDDAEDDNDDEDEDEENAFEEEAEEEEEAPPPKTTAKVNAKPMPKANAKAKAKPTPPKPKPKPKAKVKTTPTKTVEKKKPTAAKKKEKVFREGTRASRRLSQSH